MPAGPRATAESLPISDVELDDDVWTPRVETDREVTIAHQYDRLEANGCLANFRRVAGEAADAREFEDPMFIDSDAHKWLEAARYVLANRDGPDLRERVDGEIRAPDGPRAEIDQSFESDYVVDAARNVLEEVRAVVEEVGATPAQVSLRWLMDHERFTCVPIVGARTVDQLDENFGAVDVSLSDDQWGRIDDAVDV